MTRLFYLLLASGLTFVPLMVVWAAERPPTTSSSRTGHYGSHGGTYIYHSGGRGGWLGGSYGWGHGSADSGGSSSYRGGGPGGGGK